MTPNDNGAVLCSLPAGSPTSPDWSARVRTNSGTIVMEDHKLAYRIDEAVKASGIGRTKLYEAIAAGQITTRKCGNRTLILRRDLAQFLENLQAS